MNAPPPAPYVVTAQPGTRLEALAAAYAQAKPALDAAQAQLDAVKEAIKAELTNAAPGAEKIVFNADSLDAPLKLQWRKSWRLDTKKLKTYAPHIYAQYAAVNEYWELRAVMNYTESAG